MEARLRHRWAHRSGDRLHAPGSDPRVLLTVTPPLMAPRFCPVSLRYASSAMSLCLRTRDREQPGAPELASVSDRIDIPGEVRQPVPAMTALVDVGATAWPSCGSLSVGSVCMSSSPLPVVPQPAAIPRALPAIFSTVRREAHGDATTSHYPVRRSSADPTSALEHLTIGTRHPESETSFIGAPG